MHHLFKFIISSGLVDTNSLIFNIIPASQTFLSVADTCTDAHSYGWTLINTHDKHENVWLVIEYHLELHIVLDV